MFSEELLLDLSTRQLDLEAPTRASLKENPGANLKPNLKASPEVLQKVLQKVHVIQVSLSNRLKKRSSTNYLNTQSLSTIILSFATNRNANVFLSYEGAYFEPFINLPPRALKDYFRMIQEPMSLRKLQRAVKGMTGRNEATGVSEFKNWAQFEEKCKLLWTNAYYYNEEGSDIYELTQELEVCVHAI